MSATDQTARSNNQKLFDTYAKKLCSDDVNIFSEIAEKLAFWLDNEKAYYDQARPEIVKLLMIAQLTLQRAANGATDPAVPFNISQCAMHPLVPPYVKLIKIVGQFMHLFVEQELEVNLRYLVGTISAPPPPPPARAQNLQTPQGIAPSTTGSIPPQIPNTITVIKPDAMDSTAVPAKNTTQKIKRKRKTLEELIDVDLRKFRETAATSCDTSVSNITNASAGVSANQEGLERPASIVKVSIPPPLEVTLPPNLSRKLAESTQPGRWGFIEGLSGDTKPIIGAPTSANAGPLPSAGQNAQVEKQLQKVPLVASSVQTSVAEIRVKTDSSQERDICHGSTPATDLGGHDQELLKFSSASKLTVSDHTGVIGTARVDLKENDNSCTAGGHPSLTAVVAQNTSFSGTRPALSERINDTGGHMQIMDEEMEEPGNAPVTTANDFGQKLAREQLFSGISQKDHYGGTPTQASILGKIQELRAKLSFCVSQIVRDESFLKAIIADEASVSNSAISEFRSLLALDNDKKPPHNGSVGVTDVREPEASQSNLLDSTMHESIAPSCKDLNSIRNEGYSVSPDRIKVLALVRGLSNPGRVTFNFNVKPAIHLALSRWAKRSRRGDCDIDNAMCIELGCYRAAETALSAIPKDEQSRKEVVTSHQSSWPKTGDLQLTSTGGQRHSLPLSPPLLVTPDGLIDVTHLVALGLNKFELHSTRDMSRYVFALVVHPPTPAQLLLYNELRKKEQDWKDWISSLSRPINVELIPHLQ